MVKNSATPNRNPKPDPLHPPHIPPPRRGAILALGVDSDFLIRRPLTDTTARAARGKKKLGSEGPTLPHPPTPPHPEGGVCSRLGVGRFLLGVAEFLPPLCPPPPGPGPAPSRGAAGAS